MINYYKILQVADYADVSVIKRQYRRLAKKYHPDVNPNKKEAEEIIKVVNTAYSILSDPRSKTLYDEKLKYAYLGHKVETKVDEAELRKQKVEEFMKRKQASDIRKFEKMIRSFPPFYRYGIGILMCFWGLQLIYSNWFINSAESDTFFLIPLGLLLFMGALGKTLEFYDKHIWYLSMKKRSFPKILRPILKVKTMYMFLLLLAMGPVAVFGLNSARKAYHFSQYGKLAIGKITSFNAANRVRFQFYTEDGYLVIKDQFEFYLSDQKMKKSKVFIRYSEADPGIAEIVWDMEF